jgi:trk system potassium uptake protein
MQPATARLSSPRTPSGPVQRPPAAGGNVSENPRLPIGRWDVEYRHTIGLWQRITAPQLFVGSFMLLVLLGTVGLKVLPGLYVDDQQLTWLDALFTATSATCVTGLVVVDTATYYTFAGQAFLLLLIQLGGLGMVTFTSLIIVSLGRRLSLRQEALTPSTADFARQVNPRRLILDVVRFTFAIEGAGALLLYLLWIPDMGLAGAAWPAVFHAISAFCNAGFSTFSDSLMQFQHQPVTLMLIMLLVIAGGLGFLTLEELHLRYKAGRQKRIFRISLHSRLVIASTGVLLLGGWLLFPLFEWHGALGEMRWVDKVVNGLFMSVTPRTAGFNTIDYSQVSQSSSFLTMLLMMIGGSPGSTAGGMKTTTFALIGLLAWSRYRGRLVTSLQGRTVPAETMDRAIGLFVVAFGVVTLGIFVLTASEGGSGVGESAFLVRMFEAVSAFNTVGLSMGLTPELSPIGRTAAIFLMFFGRVGPLTLAAALAVRRERGPQLRYAHEDVVVG